MAAPTGGPILIALTADIMTMPRPTKAYMVGSVDLQPVNSTVMLPRTYEEDGIIPANLIDKAVVMLADHYRERNYRWQ